jgi:hypothetical protein
MAMIYNFFNNMAEIGSGSYFYVRRVGLRDRARTIELELKVKSFLSALSLLSRQ